MKFDAQKSFGYPVLRAHSDDYLKGAFQPAIRLHPVGPEDDVAKIECRFAVGIKELLDLIEKKQASFVLILDCRETFHRQCFKSYEKDVFFECDPNLLRGTLHIEAYIIAEKQITDFQCGLIHPDFGPGPHSFDAGSVLAQKAPEEYFALPDKIRSLQNLIILSEDQSLVEGEWYFDINTERPVIYATTDQCKIFKTSGSVAKNIMVNNMLVPIVAKMIEELNGEDESIVAELERYPWAQIIKDNLRAQKLSLNSKNGDAFRLAQFFLGIPQRKLNSVIEGDF